MDYVEEFEVLRAEDIQKQLIFRRNIHLVLPVRTRRYMVQIETSWTDVGQEEQLFPKTRTLLVYQESLCEW